MPRVHVPLSNLRAVVILIVVAFHSVLPYLASQPAQPFPFDEPPYRWVAFPIIDRERFFGFDLFCAWQDVSLMTLMFFLAGVFTAPSLNRKGALGYLSDRCWRIGLPFLLAAAILAPLAYFASYLTTAADPTLDAFARHWLDLPMWPAGPAWFLWQLFVLSAIAAALQAFAPRWLESLSSFAARLGDRPLAVFVALVAVSTLSYVPLALAFSAWDWASLGPFAVQLSRPLTYLVYFFAGFALGSRGFDRGLLQSSGALSRHWLLLLALAIVTMSTWGLLTSLTLPDWNASPFAYRLMAALAFPPACASGVLSLLAIALRFLNRRDRILDSLSANAYSIYLLHYVAVVWLQYALLAVALSAVAKGAIVFALALGASWAASTGLRSLVPLLPVWASKGTVADQRR
ncbi:acyltransferase family protein [Bradyrhizobium sp.]|uniref:acyltransferase family protein n=1 Tax=Bradyrhizobium sp. TaxID=376 RepID=UPI001DB8CC00|nr:acyltransferase [Bradyrhizobium sp.]MBV8698877.1 acyltransferase [Bradyrhizobium sp.]MBV8922015.1 acyltransferase [Bradyrhizobium sp.]MBV9980906.1 acyltransferase [Bradyrhizobium sp.]